MLDVLAEAALRTALLTAIVQCTLWLLRIRKARVQLAAWTIVLAASFSMPLLPSLTPVTVPLDPALSRSLLDSAAELMPQPTPQAAPAMADPERVEPSAVPWLPAIYATVASALALRVLLGLALSLRILARAVPVRAAWAAGLRVRTSREIAGPVTIARHVVLPTDVTTWPARTRHAVLAHEQAHVARLDFVLLILSQLNRAIFWFSPASWFLHRRLVDLTERASDDQAIAATQDRLGYAEILLEMGRRAGAAPRGPAMARRSSLPNRIERILLDPSTPNPARPSHQLPLALGVASLSLAVAGLTPGTIQPPQTTTSTDQQRLAADATVPEQPAALTITTLHPPLPIATTPDPQPRPQPPPSPPIAAPASLPQPRPPAPSPTRTARLTPPKPMPVPPPARDRPAPVQTAAPPPGKNNPAPPPPALTPIAVAELAAKTGSLPDDDSRWSLPQLIAYLPLSSPPRLDTEGVIGSTCLGTLTVGLGAWASATANQPAVTPGQRVPVQAQFFGKPNGLTWVRLNVFGRPPLDVPVRPARGGITWTGEYGIAYTVHDAGGNRLIGLAARVANDSAPLDLTCTRSAVHLS